MGLEVILLKPELYRQYHDFLLSHEGAVVAAGTVVTKDCEPGGVYVGHPATLRRYRERES